jgi:DNA modification methylase
LRHCPPIRPVAVDCVLDSQGQDEDRSMNPNVIAQDAGDSWAMYHVDCVEGIRGIPDASVDYSIFSPPFSSLYVYGPSERDLGNCDGDGEFFEHMSFLVPELLRVTKPGRLLSFHCMNLPTSKARDGFIGIRDFRGELIRAFVETGWIYHSEVCIWKDPVTAMQRTKALGLLHKQLKKDACMSRQGIPDFVVTMRKAGENAAPVANTNETFPVAEWQQYASPIWTDINPSDTLQAASAREEADEKHICPLQLEVVRRCLRLWTNAGDLVLSPFAGIGSEGYEAVKAGRRFLGLELKDSYWRQACANLRAAEASKRQRSLFGDESVTA